MRGAMSIFLFTLLLVMNSGCASSQHRDNINENANFIEQDSDSLRQAEENWHRGGSAFRNQRKHLTYEYVHGGIQP